jgi:hypothetical protein
VLAAAVAVEVAALLLPVPMPELRVLALVALRQAQRCTAVQREQRRRV